MNTHQLTFVNHACFHIANENTLLLIDPWLEGAVFNNGWTLLDNATSNAAMVHDLRARQLRTFIWYSHEHPDRCSLSFLQKLKQDFPGRVTILYQQARDRRLRGMLQEGGFDVIEYAPGKVITLDDQLDITVFPHNGAQAYCLIRAGDKAILNLNDCNLASVAACRAASTRIAQLAPRIDLMFTQFGYANWVGNPFEPGLRRRAAAEKRARLSVQMAAFNPVLTVPFASFMAFSSIENAYLNDYQNSAYIIRQWATLSPATETVRFMKPRDVLELERATPASTIRMSQAAVEHWELMGSLARDALPAEPSASPAEIAAAFARYLAAVNTNLPALAWLLERLGLIAPLTLHLPDIGLTVRYSYLQGQTILPIGTSFDISMSSPTALFLFTDNQGFNTTHINGRFRTASPDALLRFSRFFLPQNLLRQEYGIRHPLATAGHLAGNVLGRMRAGA